MRIAKSMKLIVNPWEKLKLAGVKPENLAGLAGFSRPTYYRAKQKLNDLRQGKCPPSKRPKRINKPSWGESAKQHVLAIRRANPTYGKAKIYIILRRDHEIYLSESTVGRILTHLKKKGLISRSSSALRGRKTRQFHKQAQR